MTVHIEGANEVAALLRRVGDKDLQAALRAANRKAAQVVAHDADPPVRTGRLQASVKATATQRAGFVRAGGRQVPYAAAIEWGRKQGNVGRPPGNRKGPNVIKGRRYLWESLQRNRDEVVEVYRREIGALFNRIGGG